MDGLLKQKVVVSGYDEKDHLGMTYKDMVINHSQDIVFQVPQINSKKKCLFTTLITFIEETPYDNEGKTSG